MSFKTKETRDGKTYFKFKAFSVGVYDLSFQKQDNSIGKTSKETVKIHVVSDAEFNAAVDVQARDVTQAEAADTVYADSLVVLGKYDAAISEYMKGYRESDGFINDRVASVYMRTGDFDAAEKYYKRNLSPAGAYTERAVLGLVRISLAKRDSVPLLS
jgi:tetratricopeptide (TPR) repeat protein